MQPATTVCSTANSSDQPLKRDAGRSVDRTHPSMGGCSPTRRSISTTRRRISVTQPIVGRRGYRHITVGTTRIRRRPHTAAEPAAPTAASGARSSKETGNQRLRVTSGVFRQHPADRRRDRPGVPAHRRGPGSSPRQRGRLRRGQVLRRHGQQRRCHVQEPALSAAPERQIWTAPALIDYESASAQIGGYSRVRLQSAGHILRCGAGLRRNFMNLGRSHRARFWRWREARRVKRSGSCWWPWRPGGLRCRLLRQLPVRPAGLAWSPGRWPLACRCPG